MALSGRITGSCSRSPAHSRYNTPHGRQAFQVRARASRAASISITLDTYSHIIEDMDEPGDAMDNAM